MELLQFDRSRRGGELIGIVILAAGICLSLALLTYHPDDSSAFYTSTNSVVANWIGYYGATIAWLFVGFFGFASLLFPGALLVVGWNRICAKEIEYLQTKAIGFVIVIIAAPSLRLVPNTDDAPLPTAGPIVREVHGAGRFQIRKVTKADLRKAAEELSKQETPDPFALWAAAKADSVQAAEFSRPVAVDDDGEFEDPLYLDDPPAVRAPRPKPQMPRPVQRKQKEAPARRETRLTHDYLP